MYVPPCTAVEALGHAPSTHHTAYDWYVELLTEPSVMEFEVLAGGV